MSIRHTHRGILGSFVVATVLVTSGCAPERSTEAREFAVDQLSFEYESIGDQLIAQIARGEAASSPRFDGRGGASSFDPFNVHGWPRTTGWGVTIDIAANGPRTSREIVTDLSSWLLAQDWREFEVSSMAVRQGSEVRAFTRGDGLSINVETTTGPHTSVQKLDIAVAGPHVY